MYPRQLALLEGHLHPALTLWLENEATASRGIWKPLEQWTPAEAARDRNLVVLQNMVAMNQTCERRMAAYVRQPRSKRRR